MFNFLKKVPLFADLPDDDLDRLCAMVTEEHISAGETLITEGEMGEKAYVFCNAIRCLRRTSCISSGGRR